MVNLENLKSSIYESTVKNIPGKITKLVKRIKPNVKSTLQMLRTNAVTPSSCNYHVTDVAEADLNESKFLDLHFKFCDEAAENKANEESEAFENEKNEELERRLKHDVNISSETHGQNSVHIYSCRDSLARALPQCASYFAMPVCVLESDVGHLLWAPLPDADIYGRGHAYMTEYQVANEQTPVLLS